METFQKSEQINEIASALCKFQADCPAMELNREVKVTMKSGGAYTFKYSTMMYIVETCRPILHANGLSFTQLVGIDGTVTTVLMHTSGQYLCSSLLIKGEQTPQGIGSAITYAKRYSLSSMLGIVSDDDDDANIAHGNEFKTKDKQETKIENNLPWLNANTKEFNGAVEKMKAGKSSIEALRKFFKISKEVQQKLNEAATAGLEAEINHKQFN